MKGRSALVRVIQSLSVLAVVFAALTVSVPAAYAAGTITQAAPTSNSTTVDASNGFTDQLNATGNNGTVTYAQGSSTSALLSVSSSGAVAVTGTLAAGTYTVSGSLSDPSLDVGTFTYVLTVGPSTITQAAPTTGTTTVDGSKGFTDQLNATGNNGTVTYAQGSSTSALLSVSSSGAVAVTGTLAAGTYTVSGSLSDPSLDVGTFTYVLTVGPSTITQAAPTTGTTTVDGSTGFTDQLNATGNNGTVTYAQGSSTSALLSVSSSGAVAVTGTLAAGTYTVSGSLSDPSLDVGTFTYVLTVGPSTITQAAPTTGTTTVDGSTGFTDQLNATGNNGTVTYAQGSSTSALLSVSSSGAVAVTGTLAAGTYTVSGSLSDPSLDVGTFTYVLTVGPSTITQAAPTTGTTTVDGSKGFTDQLNATGNNGTVTYAQGSSTSALLSVSSSGAVAVTGTLAAGTYTVSGSLSDPSLDVGTFTYVLTVGPSTITQAAPTTGTTTVDGSTGFTDQLNATGNNGTVTYAQGSSTSALLSVSSSGAVAVTGTLAAGTYTVSGSLSDTSGDSGTWKFTLTVTGAGTFTVTFNANGGRGTMVPQTESAPTALTPNAFTRTGYTFLRWNSAKNGLGLSYANGARYAFASSVTLYAQWRATPSGTKSVSYVVTFNANGGRGAMAPQKAHSATRLARNVFTRNGYTFIRWNTAKNGSGLSYANGARYAFASSVTLFAQWSASPSGSRPATGIDVPLGPFTPRSAALSSVLRTQIRLLAKEIQATKRTNITLVGYGDSIAAADQSNKAVEAANSKLSRQRAANVDAYLEQQLRSIGVRTFTIFAAGEPAASNGTPSTATSSGAHDGYVVATIS